MDLETRVYEIEKDIKSIYDRLGKSENKAAGAWNEILDTNTRVGKMENRIEQICTEISDLKRDNEQMKVDIKTVKASQDETHSEIKKMKKWIYGIAIIILVAGIVAWKKGSDIPKQVLELTLPYLNKL